MTDARICELAATLMPTPKCGNHINRRKHIDHSNNRILGNYTNRNSVAYPGILFRGVSTNSVEDRGQRERGSGGVSPLVRGSGGSCNLVQGSSLHIVTSF